jgi:tRNA dimethylallyltransferase
MEEAIYQIKLETRHFAKRQLTWVRREKEVIFLNKNEFNYEKQAILNYIRECLTAKNIIEV